MPCKLYTLLKEEQKRREIDQQTFDWEQNARENQRIPDGDWTNWLILAGRGFGKTRTGAETIRQLVDNGNAKRLALIGGSISEVLNVMVQGESGLLNITPKDNRPKFQSSTNTLTWPNGAIGHIIGATQPEKLRGPQFDTAWIDELAKFRQANALWDQLMLGASPWKIT